MCTLKEAGIEISMTGKECALDNIMIERLWRSVKHEETYLKEYADVEALRKSLGTYIYFYYNERPPHVPRYGGAKCRRNSACTGLWGSILKWVKICIAIGARYNTSDWKNSVSNSYSKPAGIGRAGHF